jgi:tetratricopeptide (TPR) repeat protein
MQSCGKCGSVNSTDSIFCGTCGNRLNNKCPVCAFDNLPGQPFCGSCGKQLQSDAELPAPGNRHGQSHPVGAAVAEPIAPPARNAAARQPAITAISQGISQNPAQAGPTQTSPETPPGLPEAYALASIEIANWEQLKSTAMDAEQLEADRREAFEQIGRAVLAANGQINASKQGVLFIAFLKEPTLRASIEKAVGVCMGLLSQEFQVGFYGVKLKIGMDIENPKNRDPLASTLERSIGLAGTLTVSETLYREIQGVYPVEMIGPIPMGNRTLHFYRIGTAQTIPELAQYLPPPEVAMPPPAPEAPPVTPSQIVPETSLGFEEPSGPETPDPQPEASVSPAEAPSAQEIVQSPPEPPIPPAMTEARTVEPAFEEELPEETPPEQPVRKMTDDRAERVTQLEESAQPELPPGPPHYEAPQLGIRKTIRQANLSYEQTIEALTSEMSGFLAEGLEAKGRMIALCGTDGLGKSNIINMVRGRVDAAGQRAIWMGGHNYRCFHRTDLPLYYWLEMIQNLLSLVFEGQTARDTQEQINRFLSFIHEGEVPPEDAAFLADFLSVTPPQPISVEAREHLGRIENFFFEFLQELAARRPVVVVVEDVQFADAASLELLTRLLEKSVLDRPVCFILTQTRDFYPDGRLAACLKKLTCKEMVLADLEDVEAERFLNDGPLGGQISEFPTQLIEVLLHHGGGLPLYLEESLRWLHLKEVLTVDPETHKFTMNRAFDPAQARLPGDPTRLIRSRLEFLNEKSLYILRLASVLGEKFAVSVLMALSQMKEEDFNQALTTLFNHGYLLPDAVNTGRFRHGLIWQAIYDDIEDDLRVQMHQLVSEALENDFNQGMTVNPMLIAAHAENGRLPNRALNYWNLAGIYAGQVGSLTGMNMAMFRAIDLLRESTKTPLHTQELALRMMESLGIFNMRHNPDLAIDALEWVLYYRQTGDDTAGVIEPLGFLASAYEAKGDFVKALEALESALACIDPRAYPLPHASMLINKLEHLYTLGRMQAALRLMEDVIEPVAANLAQSGTAVDDDSDFSEAFLQARLIKAQILLAQCDERVMPLLDETLAEARRRGLEGLTIALQLVRGQVLLRSGQYETCNHEADGLLSAIESMDDSDWFLAQWGLLAIMYHCELEDWASASQLVLTVISKSEETRDYLTWIVAQAYAGHISAKLGKVREAQKVLEQAVELSAEHHFASAALAGWRFLAELELTQGNNELAHELALRAQDVARKSDILNVHESIQLSLISARALMAQGQLKAAGKILEPLWPQVVKVRFQPLVAACAFEIGQLYKNLASDTTADGARKHLMRSVEFFLKSKGIWLELRHLARVKQVDSAIPHI